MEGGFPVLTLKVYILRLSVGKSVGLAVMSSWSSSGKRKGLQPASSEGPSFSLPFLLLSATDTFHSDGFPHSHWPTNHLSVDQVKKHIRKNVIIGHFGVLWASTCVTTVAIGVLVVISIPVLCREPHAGAVGQGIRQITREVSDVNDVVFGRTLQWELIFSPVSLLLPVLQINTQDVNPLLSKAVDFLQAQPKVICNKTVPKLISINWSWYIVCFLLTSISNHKILWTKILTLQVSEPELILVPRLVKFHWTIDPALDDSWASIYRIHLEIYSRADRRLNKDYRTLLSQLKWHIQPVNTFPRHLQNLLDLFLKASFVCLLCPMTHTQGSQSHCLIQLSQQEFY